LRCSYNYLTVLPKLPVSLEKMDCAVNRLHFLPSLPDLRVLNCGRNQLTSLPELPVALELFNCDDNHIRLLPPLPERLLSLFCKQNPLETLPELPLGLTTLLCKMPYEKTELIENTSEEILDIMEVTPEMIQHINEQIRGWTEMQERESHMRCMERCAIYKEEIMMRVWHPSRVEKLLEMGYDIEDM
jgi:Leucine-rich repeat (LRR) protein